MTDKSKNDAPQVEELSAEDLDNVNGGYLKMELGELVVDRKTPDMGKDSKIKKPRGDSWIRIES